MFIEYVGIGKGARDTEKIEQIVYLHREFCLMEKRVIITTIRK